MHTLTIWFTPPAVDFFGLESDWHGCDMAREVSVANVLKVILGDNIQYLEVADLKDLSEKDRTYIAYQLRARIPVLDAPNPRCTTFRATVATITALPELSDPTSTPVEGGPAIGEDPVKLSLEGSPLGTVQKVPRAT